MKRVTIAVTHRGHARPLREIEADAIRRALKRYPNKSEAARRLGIGRSSLYRKIKEIADVP